MQFAVCLSFTDQRPEVDEGRVHSARPDGGRRREDREARPERDGSQGDAAEERPAGVEADPGLAGHHRVVCKTRVLRRVGNDERLVGEDRMAAERDRAKRSLYETADPHGYAFCPISIETFGAWVSRQWSCLILWRRQLRTEAC